MDVVDTCQHLLKILAGSFLSELLILDNQVKELSSTGKLHHEVQVFVCLDDLVDLNHIWMVKLFEYLDLSTDPLNILLVFDFRFLQDFNSNLNKS